jgi:hypothetical protein
MDVIRDLAQEIKGYESEMGCARVPFAGTGAPGIGRRERSVDKDPWTISDPWGCESHHCKDRDVLIEMQVMCPIVKMESFRRFHLRLEHALRWACLSGLKYHRMIR